MATLDIIDLHASVITPEGPKPILHGVNLHIGDNEIHAIMGPNGSGKSTTAYALAGHPSYEITSGQVLLDGVDITDMTADERAREGLFLAMQYPVEVPGVSVSNFLRTAKTAIDGEAPKLREWSQALRKVTEKLRVDADFIKRDLNVLLRWGEETHRGAPDGIAGTEDRRPGRNRFRPGRGCAARGLRRDCRRA